MMHQDCNYYGPFDGPLIGDNIGIYCVDELFKRRLEKHEYRIVENIKIEFSEELSTINKEIFKLKNRMGEWERLSKKERKKNKIKNKIKS